MTDPFNPTPPISVQDYSTALRRASAQQQADKTARRLLPLEVEAPLTKLMKASWTSPLPDPFEAPTHLSPEQREAWTNEAPHVERDMGQATLPYDIAREMTSPAGLVIDTAMGPVARPVIKGVGAAGKGVKGLLKKLLEGSK